MTVFAEELLKKHYCREGETIKQAFIRACNCFGTNQEHSNRLQDYLNKEWFMFSSPILSNAIDGVFDGDRFIYTEQPKGLPISCFLGYIDEANDKLHPSLKAKGLRINGSNLCNKIHLPTDNDRIAVCCLSSVNLLTYDEWKHDPYFISDLIEMLDNVLTYFIAFAPKELHKAIRSASGERSLRLGAMGFTDYLQSLQIPYESSMAISINKDMFKNIKGKALKATKSLAVDYGEKV